MMRRNRGTTLVALLVAAGVAACGGDAGETDMEQDGDVAETPATNQPRPGGQVALGPAPEGADDQMVQQGQQIFTGKGTCFTCHGMDATGTQLAPNLTDDEWLNIEEPSWDAIQQNVRTGVPNPVEHPSPMPPMGGAQLSDQEIQAVSAYVYAISHQDGGATGGS